MAWTDKYVTTAGAGSHNGSAGNEWTLSEAITNCAAGQRINIKAGTYANATTNLTFATAGSSSQPIWWRGYKTTIGDQDNNAAAVAGTDIPAITWTTTGHGLVTGAYNLFSSLDFSGAYSGPLIDCSSASYIRLHQCRFTTSNASAGTYCLNAAASDVSKPMALISCYFSAPTGADACVKAASTSQPICHGCVFVGGTNAISSGGGTYGLLSFCVFDGQGGDVISLSGYTTFFVVNCSFYGGAGHGVNFANDKVGLVANCHFEGFTGVSKNGVNTGQGRALVAVGNSFYNCTGTYGGAGDFPAQFDNGTLASSGYNNPASHDFTPNAVLKAIGFPGKFQNTSTYQGYLDNGAVQSQATGSSTIIITGEF